MSTTQPTDPRRLDALKSLVQGLKDYLGCQMPDEYTRIESAELSVMLDGYVRQRQPRPVKSGGKGRPQPRRPKKPLVPTLAHA